MKIKNLFKPKNTIFSFEFFPPKTEQGMDKLFQTISTLKGLGPAFVTMTYGAGGSTQSKTVELVSHIKHKIGLEVAAHLTCVGQSKSEIGKILEDLEKEGIENIMALRGDPPKGEVNFEPNPNGFRYATQLVEFIKSQFDFSLGVAGYPEKHIEASTLEEDLLHLREKVQAGGDFIVTQLFFNNATFFSFVEKVRSMGVDVPIAAGLMPITDYKQILRFTSMIGAKIPASLMSELESAKENPEKIAQIGINYTTAQCKELIQQGVQGIHFYTLNKSTATLEIYKRLKEAELVKR